jgi:hypothetical protein
VDRWHLQRGAQDRFFQRGGQVGDDVVAVAVETGVGGEGDLQAGGSMVFSRHESAWMGGDFHANTHWLSHCSRPLVRFHEGAEDGVHPAQVSAALSAEPFQHVSVEA